MPDSTIPAPVAADPIDRLTLGATDARESAAGVGATVSYSACTGGVPTTCMAEE
jgi:hypothetical protein